MICLKCKLPRVITRINCHVSQHDVPHILVHKILEKSMTIFSSKAYPYTHSCILPTMPTHFFDTCQNTLDSEFIHSTSFVPYCVHITLFSVSCGIVLHCFECRNILQLHHVVSMPTFKDKCTINLACSILPGP